MDTKAPIVMNCFFFKKQENYHKIKCTNVKILKPRTQTHEIFHSLAMETKLKYTQLKQSRTLKKKMVSTSITNSLKLKAKENNQTPKKMSRNKKKR